MPNYQNMTIQSGAWVTANPWNGASGGIVVFRVSGSLNVAGSIDVSAKGFRGGAGGDILSSQGYQGESYNGGMTQSINKNAGGGGGGGGDPKPDPSGETGAGGAGGGYGSSGATPPYDSRLSGTPLYFGSGGGGGGGDTDPKINTQGGKGGSGGGIVLIFANTFSLPGTIAANGQAGEGTSVCQGAGGGGAGGSIRIVSGSPGIDNLSVAGGAGGDATNFDNPRGDGAAGGNGRIHVEYQIPPVITNVTKSTDNKGNGIFHATVTDDVSVFTATLLISGTHVAMNPIGGNVYEAVALFRPTR